MKAPLLRVAIATPLYRSFDYLPPRDIDLRRLRAGQRLRVPFGRRHTIGVLLAIVTRSEVPAEKLKRSIALLDDTPVLEPDILAMVQWASRYYHYPIGEAISTALPVLLRQGADPQAPAELHYRLTPQGRGVTQADLTRAPRQAAVMEQLRSQPDGLARGQLAAPAAVLRTLLERDWLETCQPASMPPRATTATASPHTLNPSQAHAVDSVLHAADGFLPCLLEGVTGSGKTEVYLQLIEQVLAQGRQALVLVPEIGLTPQLIDRFTERCAQPLAVLHSGLGDRERLTAWQQARSGAAAIVLGTRSAIFTPLARPGLIVVDEEHDASFKQQDGFRYSARDLAVWRARHHGIPVLLGSATPSLESLYNVEQGRYRHLELPERTGSAQLPAFGLVDVRQQPLDRGLSPVLLREIDAHLAADGQVLLFLNRRGFAPTLMCYDCDWQALCRRCDARMTWHQADRRLHCHHCGSQRPVDTQCPECGSSELHPQGQGTERVEQALAERFADVERLRIDRDSTRRKGSLDALLALARDGHRQLLIGTQMLAKGHHFPNVTLVAILDADHGLFSTDFRAGERMAQLIVQVAGRAGRQQRPGRVLIQTAHPDHPLLQLLVTEGYPGFARAALAERRAAALPPFSHIALLRAESTDASAPEQFLAEISTWVSGQQVSGLESWGPVPAAMERRAGRYRAQLLLQAARRATLQQLLDTLVGWLADNPRSRRVRWSLDVDPADTY